MAELKTTSPKRIIFVQFLFILMKIDAKYNV
jgi:hypothetical protein